MDSGLTVLTIRNLAKTSLAALAIAVASNALAQTPPRPDNYLILQVPYGGTGGNAPPSARAGIGAAASGANSDLTSIGSVVFLARDFPGCTWDAAHDVGPCINAAQTAAAAAGGGTVLLPGGQFGLATTILGSVTGVSIQGVGVGDLSAGLGTYQVGTELDWIGAAGGTMLDVEPSGNYELRGVNLNGIVFNAGNLANIAVKGAQFTNSSWNVAAVNARMNNIWLSTQNITAGPGMQDDDFWLSSYSDSNTYAPIGILLDGDSNSTWNPSLNHFHRLNATFNLGDAVVLGFSDNNLFDSIRTFPLSTATATGNPLVVAAKGYVSANGQQVAGKNATNGNVFLHYSARGGWVQGLTAAATIVPGTNVCTNCGPTTVPLTTNGTTSRSSVALNFPATTGVVAGENIGCGGFKSGVQTGSPINSVASTVVNLTNRTIGAVASGQACTVRFGAVDQQAVNGAYVITATGASTVNIVAPAGGHSQTGLPTASGTLSGIDLIMPWASGAMTAGDSWTVTLSKPSFDNVFLNIDSTNSIPVPAIDAGTSGAYSTSDTGAIQPFGSSNGLTIVTAAMSPYGYQPGQITSLVTATLIGAGGGGGGGPRQAAATNCSGGGGGGAGSISNQTFTPAQLSNSKTVTIGAGGTAGAAAAGDTLAGGTGGQGGDTTFGTLQTAHGGAGGAGGQLNQNAGGGGGAGLLGTALPGVGAPGGAGGGASGTGGTDGGGSGPSSQITSLTGGGTGGGAGKNGLAGAASGNNLFGPTGGGGGGGIDGTDVAYVGANGGYAPGNPYNNGNGGAVATSGSPGNFPVLAPGVAGSGGGGGGGNAAGTSGSGGNGAIGGGGGGAGCARNGSTAGTGGTGGDGVAVIVRHGG